MFLFLDEVIEDVREKHLPKLDEVYVSGFSNGALMAYRYACESSQSIVAVNAVSGAEWETCVFDRGISTLDIREHGALGPSEGECVLEAIPEEVYSMGDFVTRRSSYQCETDASHVYYLTDGGSHSWQQVLSNQDGVLQSQNSAEFFLEFIQGL